MSDLDHWAYQFESPFLSTHEWLDEVAAAGWQGTSDQVAFREAVLSAAVARKRKSRSEQRDLRASELRTVPGTRLAMRADAADAAGRLLAAANQDLAEARRTGDADAAHTTSLTGASGYRSLADQQRVWRHHFGGYYQRTAAARSGLSGGPHGPAAVAYMLDTFKISWKVAAPGFSNHQNGIAIDFQQVRTKGHPVRNSTTDAAKRIWLATWFHGWLLRRAASFGFGPYEKEPWHWEFQGPGGAAPRALTASEVDRLVEARTEGETPAAWEADEDVTTVGETPLDEDETVSDEAEDTDAGLFTGLEEGFEEFDGFVADDSRHEETDEAEELEDEEGIHGEGWFGDTIRSAMSKAGWASPSTIVVKPPRPAIAVGAITEADRPMPGTNGRNFAGLAAVTTFARDAARVYALREAPDAARKAHAEAVRLADVAARAAVVPGETPQARTTRIRDAGAAVQARPVSEVQQEIETKLLAHLEEDFNLTLEGTITYKLRYTLNQIARLWMYGRREGIDFETLGQPPPQPDFRPAPRPPAGDTLEPLGDLGTGPDVQPAMARFLRDLRRRHSGHRVTNRAGHGGGGFTGRGLSADVYLVDVHRDERGFWLRDKAVELLLAADAAAKSTGVRWRALYNDYAVALAVNSVTGLGTVRFLGQPRKGSSVGLNWHGPILLHFHIDVIPASGPQQ